MSQTPKTSIAIIGSGIAGLTTAWLLGSDYDVTLYERKPSLGLGAEGVFVDTHHGRMRIDIPPRVFNAKHYQSMLALLDETAVSTYEISQQPCFTDAEGNSYLGFKTLGHGARSLSFPRLNRKTTSWLWRHGTQLLRWHRMNQSTEFGQFDGSETVRQALARLHFPDSFRDSFLYPMWALMCTCPFEMIDEFPAKPMFELLRNFTSHYATLRLEGGTVTLEKRLKDKANAVKLEETIRQVRREDHRMHVQTDDSSKEFDHVVVATDPQSVKHFLDAPQWANDVALISQVPTHCTDMILHSDIRAIPKAMGAAINLHYNEKQRCSSASIWMNRFEAETFQQPLIQSWDPMQPLDDAKVIATRTFKRSLMSVNSQNAISDLRSKMASEQDRRIWYVGSYMGSEVPLLENGVKSARFVNERIRALQSLTRKAAATSA